jgi:hypothetical protein
MTALSDDLQAFLEAERDIDAPAPAERERLFQRLGPLLVLPAALVAATATSTGATVASNAGSVVSAALKVKIAAGLVSAALVGGAVGATGHAYLASTPASPVAAPPRSAVPFVQEPVAPKPVETNTAESPAPSATTPSVAPSLGAPRAERLRPPGSLRAERLLIETASAALMRGDPDSAIVTLQKHARQFPNGDLAAEREVLLAKARAASREGTAPEGKPPSNGSPP